MIKRLFKKLIPAHRHFKLVSLKHTLTKFKQIHYSQNGEDIIVSSYFPKNYSGFYVDVGAHHPYRISNTYLLYKNGWSGMNIDANPDAINLFIKARPKDKNLLLGVGKSEGQLTYHRFKDPAVNTFSEEHANKWKSKEWNTYLGTDNVQVMPLSKVLEKHLSKNKKIDVLSIDVEGWDLEVLESNDWEQYRPQIVIVEDHTFNFKQKEESRIYSFMKSKDYTLTDKAKFSLIFSQA